MVPPTLCKKTTNLPLSPRLGNFKTIMSDPCLSWKTQTSPLGLPDDMGEFTRFHQLQHFALHFDKPQLLQVPYCFCALETCPSCWFLEGGFGPYPPADGDTPRGAKTVFLRGGLMYPPVIPTNWKEQPQNNRSLLWWCWKRAFQRDSRHLRC